MSVRVWLLVVLVVLLGVGGYFYWQQQQFYQGSVMFEESPVAAVSPTASARAVAVSPEGLELKQAGARRLVEINGEVVGIEKEGELALLRLKVGSSGQIITAVLGLETDVVGYGRVVGEGKREWSFITVDELTALLVNGADVLVEVLTWLDEAYVCNNEYCKNQRTVVDQFIAGNSALEAAVQGEIVQNSDLQVGPVNSILVR